MADSPFGGSILVALEKAAEGEIQQATPTVADVVTDVLRNGMRSAWQQVRDPLCAMINGYIGKADLIAPGVSLYDIDCRLSQEGPLLADASQDPSAGTFSMTYRLEKNLLIASATQPYVGKWGDPRISFDYTIELAAEVRIPTTTAGQLQMTITAVHVRDPHFDSQNLVADVAKVFNDISAWLGGPNFVAKVEAEIAGYDFSGPLNGALQPVNAALAKYSGQGYGFLSGLFKEVGKNLGGLSTQSLDALPSGGAPQLILVLTSVSGPGVITGTISWDASQGAPAPLDCGAFDFQAFVPAQDPTSVWAESDLPIPVGVQACEVAASPDGSRHQITYALGGLPFDKPIGLTVTAKPSVAWDGPSATFLKRINPSGWTGHITIKPGLKVDLEGGLAKHLTHAANAVAGEHPEAAQVEVKGGPGAFSTEPIGIASAAEVAEGKGGSNVAGKLLQQVGGNTSKNVIHLAEEAVGPTISDPTGHGGVHGIDFTIEFLAPPT